MCDAMKHGNAIYDAIGEHDRLFSVDEALDQFPFDISICQESFVRPTSACFQSMVDLMSAQASVSESGVFGGVFVFTPYSFSMFCHQSNFIIFDSHAHGSSGALLSVVPIDRAVEYIQHFFSHFYPFLRFNSQSQDFAAHMSFFQFSK